MKNYGPEKVALLQRSINCILGNTRARRNGPFLSQTYNIFEEGKIYKIETIEELRLVRTDLL